MAQSEPQNFDNHARIVPIYFYVAFPLLALNLLWRGYQLVSHIMEGSGRGDALAHFLVAVALLILFRQARLMALTVQNRVVRLEERLRLERLLPENLRARIEEFTLDQLVALRFASDAELPELAGKVLNGPITDRKAIKQMIKVWRPDYLRA